jgi:hypothetical protein
VTKAAIRITPINANQSSSDTAFIIRSAWSSLIHISNHIVFYTCPLTAPIEKTAAQDNKDVYIPSCIKIDKVAAI